MPLRASGALDADAANVGRVRVRHRGRPTVAQARALETLSTRYLLDWSAVLAAGFPANAFGSSDGEGVHKRALAVEIGFGNGNALAAFAAAHSDWNCVGVDVYQPGFGALMLACERESLTNVRIVNAEATTFLRHLAPNSVRAIHVFFPDPWPKKRHHKRRLVNAEFVAAAAACLEPGGALALATDDAGYAERMANTLDAEATLRGGVAPRPERPLTPFEARARAAGRAVVELAYRREKNPFRRCDRLHPPGKKV